MSRITVDCPFPAIELPSVWTWLNESGLSLLTDQGAQTASEFVQSWMNRNAVTFAVYQDQELGGWIAYEPMTPVTGNAHCVFRKSFWGRETTIPALNLVAGMLFDEGVLRIGMNVREDNRLVQRTISELGGLKEALWYRQMDGSQVTDKGVPVHMIQYGLYREVWYEKQNTEHQVVDFPLGDRTSGVA